MTWPVRFESAGVNFILTMIREDDCSSIIDLYSTGRKCDPVGPRADYDILVGTDHAGWLTLKQENQGSILFGRLIIQNERPPLCKEYFEGGQFRKMIDEITEMAATLYPHTISYFTVPFIDVLVIGKSKPCTGTN